MKGLGDMSQQKSENHGSRRSGIRPVLLLEINEIPWRFMDRMLTEQKFPNLRRFFEGAATFTTVSRDTGELSPWVTWPSLHRGITNTEHGISYLGQEVSTFGGIPIWEEYRKKGLSVGVCGSLQSWPPKDPGPGGFFVPDTFAHDEQCIPAYLEPLQRFNLALVRQNGRVVESKIPPLKELLQLLPTLRHVRFGSRTLTRVATQLVQERFKPTYLARRTTFQTMLFWDLFKGLYQANQPPAFATFFTNHIAGLMHRYWNQIFPEDFGNPPGQGYLHTETFDFAVQVLDEMLEDVFGVLNQCPDLIVVFATSMGQAAIHRNHEGIELSLPDVSQLMHQFGVSSSEFQPLLAMVPQVAVRVAHDARRSTLLKQLQGATTLSKAPMFDVNEVGTTLSITVRTPSRADIAHGRFYRHDAGFEGSMVAWSEAGITTHEVDAGTAYHIPEGVMAVYGRGIPADARRTTMAATDVKSYLMDLGGLEVAPSAETPKVRGSKFAPRPHHGSMVNGHG